MTILDRKRLEELCGGRAKLNKKKSLDLNDKGFTEIAKGTFANLPNVTSHVDLGGNQLGKLFEWTFDGLVNLEELNLNTNEINEIDPRAFKCLPALKCLNLTYNRLVYLSEGSFDNLVNLRELWLSYNEIQEIAPGLLTSLSNLVELRLVENDLIKIVEGTFDGLDNVQEIDLSCNQIAKIAFEAFLGLKKINILDIDANPIASQVFSFYDGFSTSSFDPPQLFISNWEGFLRQFLIGRESIIFRGSKPKPSAKARANPFAAYFECSTCRETIKDPVILPCGHSICKRHQEGLTAIECRFCERSFEIPQPGGFGPNKTIEMMLNRGVDRASFLCDEFAEASREFDNFKEVVNRLKSLRQDSSARVHEAVRELRARVDLRREELKAKIDKEALKLIEQLNQYEKECQANAEKLDMAPIDAKLAPWEADIQSWKTQLSGFQRDLDKWKLKLICSKSKAKSCEGENTLQELCRDIFSDGVQTFCEKSKSMGTHELIRGRTLTLFVDNLADKLNADYYWQGSERTQILGINFLLNIRVYSYHKGHKVNAYFVAEMPSIQDGAVIDFELVLVCGREKKKELVKKSESHDFGVETESCFESLIEFTKPIENDPNLGGVDSFELILNIKTIDFI